MAMYQAKKTDEETARETEAFFATVADEDLLRFLRQLPVIWGNEEQMTLADFTYEALLWPFIKSAWATVDGALGLPGRLRQLSEVFALAERELQRETGRTRRVPRVTNLTAFMSAYTDDRRPS